MLTTNDIFTVEVIEKMHLGCSALRGKIPTLYI